jgi:hypothetical protein
VWRSRDEATGTDRQEWQTGSGCLMLIFGRRTLALGLSPRVGHGGVSRRVMGGRQAGAPTADAPGPGSRTKHFSCSAVDVHQPGGRARSRDVVLESLMRPEMRLAGQNTTRAAETRPSTPSGGRPPVANIKQARRHPEPISNKPAGTSESLPPRHSP